MKSSERPGDAWNKGEFLQIYARAKTGKDYDTLKKLLATVAESNYRLMTTHGWPVPRTVAVPWKDAAAFSIPGGAAPVVSFSELSTVDAMLYFARNRRNTVCGLNFANGKDVGGGYKHGSTAQEEDLCRRIPQLYSSLYKAQKDSLYPFGPPTCTRAEVPEKYSDVLFTGGLWIVRGGEEDGFEVLPREEQVEVSLVAAAAPNLRFGDKDVNDAKLLYRTMCSIFVAPRLVQPAPAVNVLVLGAWGCGAFGGDPVQIADMFVRALVQDNYGQLYKEVHFAIPKGSPENMNHDAFRKVFEDRGIQVNVIGSD